MADQSEVLARVQASPPRRALGVGCLYVMGGLLIYLALARPPAPLGLAFFLLLGAAALWLAEALRRSTKRCIELTRTALCDDQGRVLATLNDIEVADRGLFAFKPSNGFLLRTKTRQSRVWQPGLWWRLGRYVGVVGVTAAHQTKPMAEIIQALLADQDASLPQDGRPGK